MPMLSQEELAKLDTRWRELHDMLDALHSGRVVPNMVDPLAIEDQIQKELDAIEYETGVHLLEVRRRGGDWA